MNVDLNFATPIAIQMIHDKWMCSQYSNLIIKIAENEFEPVEYVPCQVTPDNLHERQEFTQLVDIIDEHVKQYAQEVVGVDPNEIKLDCMWANVHGSGHRHNSHIHPNSFISGAFYLRIPKCERVGEFVVIDPRQSKNVFYADFKKRTHLSERSLHYVPETGMMLLFPGWLEHGTTPFICSSGEKRVVVSFNYSLLKCSTHSMRINHGS